MEKAMAWLESFLEKSMFNSRWLLAPFFVGLIISIGLLLGKFIEKLVKLITNFMASSTNDVISGVLSMVDMALIASLLLMVVFSGYEIFVSKIDVADHEDKPDWMGQVDFGGLKLKVISAIVAISAVDLLVVFLSEAPYDETRLFWKVIIHIVFVISGLIFAITEYIAHKQH